MLCVYTYRRYICVQDTVSSQQFSDGVCVLDTTAQLGPLWCASLGYTAEQQWINRVDIRQGDHNATNTRVCADQVCRDRSQCDYGTNTHNEACARDAGYLCYSVHR